MANVSVYNMEGKEVGTMELNDAVFGVEVNDHLVHLAVVRQLANNRQGTQKAKTRSEVSGGGRKPWMCIRDSRCKADGGYYLYPGHRRSSQTAGKFGRNSFIEIGISTGIIEGTWNFTVNSCRKIRY